MNDLQEFRRQKDEFFRSSHHSPLLPEQKADFHGLRYFPPSHIGLLGKPPHHSQAVQEQR